MLCVCVCVCLEECDVRVGRTLVSRPWNTQNTSLNSSVCVCAHMCVCVCVWERERERERERIILFTCGVYVSVYLWSWLIRLHVGAKGREPSNHLAGVWGSIQASRTTQPSPECVCKSLYCAINHGVYDIVHTHVHACTLYGCVCMYVCSIMRTPVSSSQNVN